ncbi:hypothetical protein NS228_11690 [Methylobacterium indicum]|jgi:hypothetical protein|uniref:Uncharacterized protein n=3 Tax=Methylobacterium TaxID=407 RepID=A0A0J6R4X5_9HYPH|nr:MULTISPECIES: hypothetical protein [Methylobacterium]KMO16588.1 hypothetical protein QR78_19320 [Methylobacterium indicum]KMO21772.1 hypothetical protein QR79_16490 [Methylobacterium indicum]KTS39047.1 hypothetical protein NS229_01770 [Methylobacterium indicum]KTS40295.1 hypothetical protein NS228_11690 [Methylobacterium indicum]KTS47757.1 hypothetical protein NS230_20395 [Methylobacterium indicum]
MSQDDKITGLTTLSAHHGEMIARLSEAQSDVAVKQVALQMAVRFVAGILRGIDSDHYRHQLGSYLAMLEDALNREDPDSDLARRVLETVKATLEPEEAEEE